jgi:hypothetical protein
MFLTLQLVVSKIPLLLIAVAAFVSLRSFRHNVPLPYKHFSLLWLLVFMTELLGHTLQVLAIPNHWLYNVFNFVFYLTLVHIYSNLLGLKNIIKIRNAFFILFSLLTIVNSIFYQSILRLQTVNIVVGGFCAFCLIIFYLIYAYQNEIVISIKSRPFFWFSIGLALYFGGTIPFLGMLNYLWENHREFSTFYYIYIFNIFSLILNIFVIIGFSCNFNSLRYS